LLAFHAHTIQEMIVFLSIINCNQIYCFCLRIDHKKLNYKYKNTEMKKSLQIFPYMLIFLLVLFSGNTKAQSPAYGYVHVGGGGYVCSVIESITEDNMFYAKTDVGGISRWVESTKTWKPLHEWLAPGQTSYMGTEAFAIDPNSPNKIYAIGGTTYWNGGATSVMRSSDRGETWDVVDVTAKFKANGNGSDRQKGETLAVDPVNGNILYFGTRYNNGLFKSTDAGVTWNRITTFPDSIGLKSSFSFVHFDYDSETPNGCSTIYVGNFKTGNNVHVSYDFGISWQSVNGFKTGKPQRYATSIYDRNLYITYTSTGAVMKYNMDNNSWQNVTPATGRNWSGIAVDMDNPNKIVTTTYNYWSAQQPWGWGDQVFYSANGGSTWINKSNNGVCTMENNGIGWMERHALHWAGCATMSHSKPGRVFVVSGNGIFATENIAAASPVWKVVSHGLEETVPVNQGMISIPNGPLITTFGDINGFVHTDINKYPASQISQSVSFAFAPSKPSTIVRTVNLEKTVNSVDIIYSVVMLSENNGASWTQLPVLPVDIKSGTVSVSADGNIILWKGNNTAEGTRHYWTNNKGATWNLIGLTINATPTADAIDPLKFYILDTATGYIYTSIDGGKTYKAISNVGTGGSSIIKAALGHEGHIWINSNNKIKYSIDGGKTFTTTTNYNCSAFALGKEAPGTDYPTIYIWGKSTSATPEAMYRSIDKGQTWIRANDDLHQWGHLANAGNIEADKNIYGRTFKSTAGMGIPWMGLEGFTTIGSNVEYKVNVEIYPVPFNNSCTLKSKNSNVKSIVIYNLQGAMVENITTDMFNNESIELGSKLSKGAYLVKVTDTMGSSTFKIVKQ